MEYTTLGRTGLRASVAGLGCGGKARLGLARGRTLADAAALVRAAVDLGINVVDTAGSYGTEEAVGLAMRDIPRDDVILCTKQLLAPIGAHSPALPPEQVVAGLDNSLRTLGVDYVDVFYIHSLMMPNYDYAMRHVVPALLREKEKGKFRFLGVTEWPTGEARHDTLVRALDDDVFDVMMVAFQFFHQNAREFVFPKTMRQKVGTTLMCVVRNIFADPAHLKREVRSLADKGLLPSRMADMDDPLDFLVHPGGAGNVIEAAYRFGRHEPGADVVLFGTGDPGHLRDNVRSILSPPLPQADLARIRELFGHLAGVGLGIPR
jgi:aryl-alcohol dehydrogenase-like predicted oxidoreductase